ncbi:hypothetical protein H5400_23715 [Rhodococcus wratislaviensis]|nr:hypothetical protein [Rhodococcus sp. 3A]
MRNPAGRWQQAHQFRRLRVPQPLRDRGVHPAERVDEWLVVPSGKIGMAGPSSVLAALMAAPTQAGDVRYVRPSGVNSPPTPTRCARPPPADVR